MNYELIITVALAAAIIVMNESKGTPNPILAEKYATRALEIAKNQTEKRDTILGKSLELLSTVGMYNNNYEQLVGYYDQAILKTRHPDGKQKIFLSYEF